MSDARYQVQHIEADNSYTDYLEAQYWAERERLERRWHVQVFRKLQRLADLFDVTFGWFFSPRRYN